MMAAYDPDLGKQIAKYLMVCHVETPTTLEPGRLYTPNQPEVIANHIRGIMEALHLDMSDDSLKDTPDRVAKMYMYEVFSGLDYHHFPKCTTVTNQFKYDEMVLSKNISCISICEHHLVTIDMKVHIAYVPDTRVLGLSKLNRVAKFFAQRPQIQERYTEQVYYALSYILGTQDIAVVVDGKHYCVVQRGVEDTNSTTITSKLGGGFKANPALRAEFMALIK